MSFQLTAGWSEAVKPPEPEETDTGSFKHAPSVQPLCLFCFPQWNVQGCSVLLERALLRGFLAVRALKCTLQFFNPKLIRGLFEVTPPCLQSTRLLRYSEPVAMWLMKITFFSLIFLSSCLEKPRERCVK